ncbi:MULTISPECIES: ABC transporter substrate-binding protein [Streptomyces]|uniref:ABC transporter substrate-binding protein n=1 Tax=Streptomyces TaxID=1883 RepID=UPI00163BBCBD|nr:MULTISPECIES: ABC transporter substrate-binding protein [unclassified Streptomyces]QTI90240.1 ABC transporter substrate-binding protein [Streptomyces sp. AgN23]WTA86358.1 ABC transporter substrate-binding protein [Streptomyces antimycoticus]WTB03084.1 ABC transporter substrate-binding protein [Streptomyces antimycoticus]
MPRTDLRRVSRRSGVSSLSSALIAMAALAGCSGSPADADRTVTVDLAESVACVDPHQAPQTSALNVARQLVDSLTDQDPRTGKIVGWIASRWTVNSDATRFVFTLRSGATFSDGTPVNAAAVVANLKDITALGAKSPLGISYLANLRSAVASDSRTVTVEFSKPSAQFLQATSTPTLGLLSPATLKRSSARRCTRELAGSGPFTLDTTTTADKSFVLKTRRDYAWPTPLARHTGAARVGGVTFRIVPAAQVRHGNLVSGQADVDAQVQPQDVDSFTGTKLTLLSQVRPGLVYTFLPNETSAVLSDPAVRVAISRGIDRSAFAPLLSRAEKPATSLFATSTPQYSDRSAQLSYDRAKATELLDKAGWVPGGDGIRQRAGRALRVRLVYASTDPYSSVYQLIAQQLRKIGVDLALTPLDDAANNARQAGGDYDLVSWAVTRGDPSVLSTVFPVGSANPLRRTTPGKLEQSISAVGETLDTARRQRAADASVDLILDGGHGIPLFEQAASVGVADTVKGIRLDASSRPLFYDAEVGK